MDSRLTSLQLSRSSIVHHTTHTLPSSCITLCVRDTLDFIYHLSKYQSHLYVLFFLFYYVHIQSPNTSVVEIKIEGATTIFFLLQFSPNPLPKMIDLNIQHSPVRVKVFFFPHPILVFTTRIGRSKRPSGRKYMSMFISKLSLTLALISLSIAS